ncbi:MAG TPA: DUF5110 domain-containing protein, partial [Polyangiaceae bacterium]|nr:DUF5110 domain-containing protein [Polyangiaceae bacterium]
GNEDHYSWSFGVGVERVARASLMLRYRLLPYLYAAFLEASETGAPVQRPLVFDFQDDIESRRIDDQFLLGSSLLVAPVLKAGQTARHVYLPPGDWVDFHSGERHAGESYVTLPAPLGKIPLLVRAGAVIPMLERAPDSTHGLAPELIELHVFAPGRDGSYESLLYEDDGVSRAHERGAHLRTRLTLVRSGATLLLRAAVSGQSFPQFQRRRLRVVLHAETPLEATLDTRPLSVDASNVVFDDRGGGFELRITLA